jgi:hypothetical protein
MHDPAMADPAALLLGGFDARTYLRALIAVVRLHGVEEVEREYVNARAALLDVDPTALWEERLTEFPPIAEEVSVTTRRAIVRDCLLMGCLDGDLSDAERERIYQIAGWLDVERRTCDLLEDWLHRYFDMMDEMEALLSGFDPPDPDGEDEEAPST